MIIAAAIALVATLGGLADLRAGFSIPVGPAEAGPSIIVGDSGRPRTTSGLFIADIRVHGNLIVTTDEVLALIGVAVGDAFGPTTIADVTARLKASGKFDRVEVLQRFASIEDPSRIALVVIVNEGPVRMTGGEDGAIRVVRRRGWRNLLFLPILEAEDGYGMTYGARLALAGAAGGRSRISVPLTWGGHKQAAVEVDRAFASGPFTRVQAGTGVRRETNPAFDLDDTRRHVWGRLERAAGPARAGTSASWNRVSFAESVDTFRSIGLDVTIDTRIDPVSPRNAVLASASWERLSFESGRAVHRYRLEGRGYVGLPGRVVLGIRAVRESAGAPLPPYLKSLLGGWSNLRGFRAGTAAGDSLAAGSFELRVPLNSPLRVAKYGVNAFADTGTAYDHGERFRDQTLRRGYGGGVWLSATVLHLGLSIAHGGDSGTRVNFGGGLSF